MCIYELSGSGFESICYHLNFRFRACFEQGVPWHSGNYRVWFILSKVSSAQPLTLPKNKLLGLGILKGFDHTCLVTYICSTFTLEGVFRNGVGSTPVGSNNPSVGGWILQHSIIQHKKRSLTKYWDLTENYRWTEISSQVKLPAAR